MSGMALSVRDLSVRFPGPDGAVAAVEGISLDLAAGEVVGLVGESGCGKSVTALALMGLLGATEARVDITAFSLAGRTIPRPDGAALRQARGTDIAMIFQEPATALDPVFTVGWQLERVIRRHGTRRADTRARALEALAESGFPEPEEIHCAYPGQLSGGMRQLAMVAMAMALRPRVLIADEPTTALDVTSQQRVLTRLLKLRKQHGTAILLITHDLGVVAQCCSRILVMYCGRIVEQAPYAEFHARPRHPYSAGLLAAIPRLGTGRLTCSAIPGQVPVPGQWPAGCPFHPRCQHAGGGCSSAEPELRRQDGRWFACHYPL
jgi:oligopeptide/dipeptide ABC transporter ATP-binding protein